MLHKVYKKNFQLHEFLFGLTRSNVFLPLNTASWHIAMLIPQIVNVIL